MPRYSAAELREKVERGESRTNWARLDATTDAEIEAANCADPDCAEPIPEDWWQKAVVRSGAKQLLSIRVDPDVLEWFRDQGAGYQTRMNAALRAFMEAHRRGGGGSAGS